MTAQIKEEKIRGETYTHARVYNTSGENSRRGANTHYNNAPKNGGNQTTHKKRTPKFQRVAQKRMAPTPKSTPKGVGKGVKKNGDAALYIQGPNFRGKVSTQKAPKTNL